MSSRTKKMWLSTLFLMFPMGVAVAGPQLTTPSIQDNTQQDSASGRGEKAGAAQDVSNQGQNTSMINGTILMTAAIPMLASPFIPTKIAGADLMAKAALEFAQSAADGNTANQNKAQKDLLATVDAPNSQIPTTTAPDLSALDQFLQSQGVANPQAIEQQVAGGNLDPNSLLNTLGAGSATPDEQAQGLNLANSSVASLLTPTSNSTVPNFITTNESADTSPSPSSDGSGSGSSAPGAGAASFGGVGTTSDPASSASTATAGGQAVTGKSRLDSSGSSDTTGATKTSIPFNLAQVIGLASAPGPDSDQKSVALTILQNLGVSKLNSNQNIFQTAHRNFRAFSKWRKETRVATAK